MSKVQPAKVATIDEVKTRIASSTTAVVTEYRGLTVAQISTLRRQLRTLGADYKVFKNTLVRRAIAGTDVESLSEFLVGPTAIAFIDGDVSAVAKALRDFARETPKLIVKGGVATPAEDKVEEVAETPAGVEEAAPAASDDDATPVAEVAVEEEAPAAEPETEAPVDEEAPAAESETEAPVAEEAPAAEPEAEVAEAPTEDAAAEPAE